jgi:proteasome lid subunit RPN8/RPN11
MINLPPQWESVIRHAGEESYPNECCGVLLGTLLEDDEKRIEGVLPIDNGREAEEQYHRFEIGPEDYLRAEKEARKAKLDVLGFYHSHPDHPAIPSEFDRDHALPFYSYIIVAVEKGKAGELTSWELKNDRSEFLPEATGGGN